jgi:hypothetical protein
MSDSSDTQARPVSLITTAFIMALFVAFVFVVRHYYVPTSTSPQNAAAENLSKDLDWKATNAARRATLQDLRAQEAKQVTSYGWVDQKAGVVRLPIDRAMELTAAKYGAKK